MIMVVPPELPTPSPGKPRLIDPHPNSHFPLRASVTQWFSRPWILSRPFLILVGICLPGVGCQEYRIEYHKRPGFFQQASEERLPDRIVLDDGTIILYGTQKNPATRDTDNPKSGEFGESGGPLPIREEHDDGSITLRCLVPKHVLMNALTCLQLAEFDLLYEQLIAQQTKDAYELMQKDPEPEVIAYFTKHRKEIARTLKYMIAGLPLQRIKYGSAGEGVTRFVIRPQFARGFKFSQVDLVQEGRFYKLKLVS